MIARALIAVGALTLASCSPQAGASYPADAPFEPFFGKWQLVRAQVAPWWDGQGDEPRANPDFNFLEFQKDKSVGDGLVACDKPEYTVSTIDAEGLFEGNLSDPWQQARMLGFVRDAKITSMHFACATGGKDVALDFPMQAEDTILTGVDNMIYWLQRTPK
jgi:hypothetical protein